MKALSDSGHFLRKRDLRKAESKKMCFWFRKTFTYFSHFALSTGTNVLLKWNTAIIGPRSAYRSSTRKSVVC